jgi:hypothetical protein
MCGGWPPTWRKADPPIGSAAPERFCGEWITVHAGLLGRLLANAGHDGGQALLTLVRSRPWQGFDHTVWGRLVEPWLVRAEADHIAQPFLTAALQSVGRAPTCLVEASVGWLVRRGDQTDTEHLLLALLDRPDLTLEAQEAAVDRTLAWVPSRPDWRHTPALLKRLLRMRHPGDRLERVVEVVRDWLTPYRSFGVAPVVRAFLQRADIGAAARQEIIDRMLTWLRSAHRGGDRARLTRCALDWLEQQWTHPRSGRVLRSLLSEDGCPPDLRPRLITFAQWWATERSAGLPGRSFVLDALLSDGSAPGNRRFPSEPSSPSSRMLPRPPLCSTVFCCTTSTSARTRRGPPSHTPSPGSTATRHTRSAFRFSALSCACRLCPPRSSDTPSTWGPRRSSSVRTTTS